MKQIFSIKYKNVWEISDDQHDSKSEHDYISQSFNTWIRYNKDTNIGKLEDDLLRIYGLNNDLLFITHYPKNIEVIDLKITKSKITLYQKKTIDLELNIIYEKLPICFILNDFTIYSFGISLRFYFFIWRNK
ncbi:hypothetical protein RFI_28527 [Reticulomyxa filosa]|uniref:Uncharacterized protein n=1 Tax=Reticulomyxa filosa TaxID=46433 RepID=X6M4N5_RETFI|nr:hypothetical protein RFI_28527 [Reticulomyxa filosa]|eukprot:ETO08859.1 hypothetical protein RFI_28527 [Reticulomyxa filosa]